MVPGEGAQLQAILGVMTFASWFHVFAVLPLPYVCEELCVDCDHDAFF